MRCFNGLKRLISIDVSPWSADLWFKIKFLFSKGSNKIYDSCCDHSCYTQADSSPPYGSNLHGRNGIQYRLMETLQKSHIVLYNSRTISMHWLSTGT